MRPETGWMYWMRRAVTDDEFEAWLVAILGAAALTLATVLMGVR